MADDNQRVDQLASTGSSQGDQAPPRSAFIPATSLDPGELVPDDVIPHLHLPPLQYRELPEPISWRKMIGPSIMLAGLSLGSGEFIFWPYIVYSSGFVFFWACLLGVITQFFINMEIERWTLATGETAITGFCRMCWVWAPVMLVMNIIPWAWPGWATGAAQMLSWTLFGPLEQMNAETGAISYGAQYLTIFAVVGLFLVGIVLTSSPVVYNTVEKLQTFLVASIVIIAFGLGIVVIRPDAVMALLKGAISVGEMPDLTSTGKLSFMGLLGALAFAGAGGTMNLGQSNLIRDKGYGMGRYIGRITSPLTGQEEPAAETGYHFRHTPENMRRWSAWWKAANIEHFFSFFLTCVVCLVLMSLISYSLLYDEAGQLKSGAESLGTGFSFVWSQARYLEEFSPTYGTALKYAFLVMGVCILFTTELGVLDVSARISTDIIKVNFLRDNDRWPQSRLYFLFLWGEILLGTAILIAGVSEPQLLLQISAALNGGVMFLYSLALLYMNSKILSRNLSLSPLRFVALVWGCAFFGYFVIQAIRSMI